MSEEILVIGNQFAITLDVDATVEAWVNKTSSSNLSRAKDIKNDKARAIFNFFDYAGKSPERVLPQDVIDWQNEMQAAGSRPERFITGCRLWLITMSSYGLKQASLI